MNQGTCELCGIWDSALVKGLCPCCAAKITPAPQALLAIGIAGPARCGKDTVADLLLARHPDWRKASFADPIKEMLKAGLGLSDAQLWGDDKDRVDPRYSVSPRYMLQTLGTEWGRELVHRDLWVLAMEQRIGNGLIIPDVRFPNEAAFVRKHGVLIHITGRGGIDGDHVSEAGVVACTSDLFVYNGGDLSDLKAHIEDLPI